MLHKVSPLPTSAFAFFRSTKSSLGSINTSILAPSLWRWDSSSLSPITTLVFQRLCLRSFEVPASTSGHSFYIFLSVHWERGWNVRCRIRRKQPVFLVILKQILILATYPSAEINNSQNICHSGHSGRYQVFEHSHGEVVPYRKSYQTNLR